MAEQEVVEQQVELTLDEDARRALAQVYRLLLKLADEAELSETSEQASEPEEDGHNEFPD